MVQYVEKWVALAKFPNSMLNALKMNLLQKNEDRERRYEQLIEEDKERQGNLRMKTLKINGLYHLLNQSAVEKFRINLEKTSINNDLHLNPEDKNQPPSMERTMDFVQV